MKRIMAIGSHPDDVEFGCGGTLYNHKLKGDYVVYVCMTNTESVDGTNGTVLRTAEENRLESINAAKVLQCDYVEFLPFKDLHVPFSFDSVSKLESLIKKHKVDTIYTHWAGDANQDHISTFKTTMAAARYVPNVFCYEQIPISRLTENQMDINYYENIEYSFDKKIEAAMCHKSQISKYKKVGLNVKSNLEVLAKFRGIQGQCKYAESFKILKMINTRL